jgi:hypothetical protein
LRVVDRSCQCASLTRREADSQTRPHRDQDRPARRRREFSCSNTGHGVPRNGAKWTIGSTVRTVSRWRKALSSHANATCQIVLA